MRTRKGPKRENTTRPPAYIRRKRKRKPRRTGAQNRTVQATTSRRHYKEDTNRSQLSRKGRKKETASGGKKDRTKTSPKSPQRNRPQAPSWKRQGAAAPAETPRIRTTCGPPEISSQGRNSNVLSEPHAEEKRS